MNSLLSSRALTDGRHFAGAGDLYAMLTVGPDQLAHTFVAHLSRYAT
jgi:hypothetical protein